MEASPSSKPARGGQRSTWIAFAGVMMVMLGSLDAIWGLAAILNDEVVIVGGRGALILDITTWGWIQLILGLLVGLTGLGLLVGNQVAPGPRDLASRDQRRPAGRLVPGGAAVGVPDHHRRHGDRLPAVRRLGR
jgi:hypothetical protein